MIGGFIFSGSSFKSLNQWIGLRDKLQESPILHGKITLVSG